ncbi:MAG: hypothetical protein K0R54_3336 [Clostridiaceae bacterium]|jgi:hypothetical protein|nr:hypothetical protein [Clostridiaceae bacterium]
MIIEKIQVDKKDFDNIIQELQMLKLRISDRNSSMLVEKILNIMNSYEDENQLTLLKKRIKEKMKEVRYTNSQFNSDLYILLRNLEEGKTSVEQTSAVFVKLMLGEALEERWNK